jgi:hypothetical protein
MRGAKGGAGRKGIDHETQPAGLWPPTRANGQVAFGVYAIEPETGSYLPIALDVLTLRGDLISDVTAFRARCAILFGFLTAVFAETLTLRSLGDRRLRVTAGRFADAFERGEIDTILAMLAEDATFAMPPYPEWRRGRDAMTRSWLMPVGPRSLRYLPTQANGQLAFGVYAIEPETGSYLPIALDVVTLRGDLIADVTAFRTPMIFPRFELPDRLPASSTP